MNKRLAFKPRFLILLMLIVLALCISAVLSQEKKLNEIAIEKAALTEEHNALLAERERLTTMIEYVKSDEYRIRMAMERLGFVASDDIVFNMDDAQ